MNKLIITSDEDRKQTKYGHKRQEHMTHTTEPWHNSPLPEGVSHAVTVPPGRGGGGRSGGPSGQTRTGTQDGDLQSGTDNGDHGGAGSSGGHGGARSSGGHGGAGSSGGHGGAGSSGGHGRWTSGSWPRSPRPGPYSWNSYYPPKKNFPGEVRGYQEPSGAKQTRQYKTRQERPPGPDRQDRTAHRNQKPSWAGLEAEASSGHDMTSGALSNRLHLHDKGAGG